MSTTKAEIAWPTPPPDLSWKPGEEQIHVYAFSLDLTPERLAVSAATLSAEERARAGRFHFETHRNRYTAGRSGLRAILSRYLGIGAQAVEFQYSARGKPALSGAEAESGLTFNLTHTGGLALLAVGWNRSIGIDVEEIRVLAEFDSLVERFFSRRESASFRALPGAEKPVAFFNLWTRKEAWLKATGQGLGGALNRVEVTFLPEEPAQFLALPPEWEKANRWRLRSLAPAPGFTGALVFTGDETTVQCWGWPEAVETSA